METTLSCKGDRQSNAFGTEALPSRLRVGIRHACQAVDGLYDEKRSGELMKEEEDCKN